MAVEGGRTLSLRRLLDEGSEKVTLLWVPSHMEIPGNEITEEEAKSAMENDLLATTKYPPKDLIYLIKTEDKKTRKTR
jgi:ribonuclease HI